MEGQVGMVLRKVVGVEVVPVERVERPVVQEEQQRSASPSPDIPSPAGPASGTLAFSGVQAAVQRVPSEPCLCPPVH